MSESIEHPLKWLVEQLPAYVPAARLRELLERLETQKRRYVRQSKISETVRQIRTTERFPPSPATTARLERLRAKLAKLRAEE